MTTNSAATPDANNKHPLIPQISEIYLVVKGITHVLEEDEINKEAGKKRTLNAFNRSCLYSALNMAAERLARVSSAIERGEFK